MTCHGLSLSGSASLRYTRPDGTPGWRVNLPNSVTDEGIDWLLNVGFAGLAQSPQLYLGVIDEAGYTGVDPSDTHTSHPGWSEWTAVASVNRPIWIPMAANGGLMGTVSPTIVNITADGQIRGCFLTTVIGVGSVAAGVLYNTVIALAGLDVESGGTLEITPSVRLGE